MVANLECRATAVHWELKLKITPYIIRTHNELVLGGGAVGFVRPS